MVNRQLKIDHHFSRVTETERRTSTLVQRVPTTSTYLLDCTNSRVHSAAMACSPSIFFDYNAKSRGGSILNLLEIDSSLVFGDLALHFRCRVLFDQPVFVKTRQRIANRPTSRSLSSTEGRHQPSWNLGEAKRDHRGLEKKAEQATGDYPGSGWAPAWSSKADSGDEGSHWGSHS